jgi:prepilin-type processing-associated H-X9-DG protein
VAIGDISDGTSNTIMLGERPTGQNGFSSSWYTGWGVFHFAGAQIMPLDGQWVNAPVPKTWCEQRTVFQAGKYDDPCHHNHFWSLHPGGANFAFADGSVKFLRYSAASVLPALATRAGGEVVPLD